MLMAQTPQKQGYLVCVFHLTVLAALPQQLVERLYWGVVLVLRAGTASAQRRWGGI